MPGAPARGVFIAIALLLPELDRTHAKQFAEKIRQLVQDAEFRFRATTIPITISLGVAMADDDVDTAADLLEQADRRLYEAKHAGRNRVG